jgi:hypothetical protein
MLPESSTMRRNIWRARLRRFARTTRSASSGLTNNVTISHKHHAAQRILRDLRQADTSTMTPDPMTRKNRARITEYLREAGWSKGPIGAAAA